ncbi:MAG: TerB N-terminal domain-containing protein, partial [Gemmatimonadota bacterium]|nr:TerB N-terminal domain-containing protein [Gemmatimonadota bacterium]
MDARWIPAEEAIEIAGRRIESGMIYVGTHLPAIQSWVGEDPALIDPTAKVSTDTAEIAAAAAGYWPSYSTVSPTFRAKYLRWLAGGRKAPGVDIGCVFLFFYGLERRVLIDAE